MTLSPLAGGHEPPEAADPREVDVLRDLHALITMVNSSDSLHEVLHRVAHGVVDVLGWSVAAVNYLREDNKFEAIAVAGPLAAVQTMKGRFHSLAAFEAEFANSDAWGLLRFVPAARSTDNIDGWWIPPTEVSADPNAWHPLDALYAPLHAPDGRLVGVLSVDLPPGGRRPSALSRQALEIYAIQAGVAIHFAQAYERKNQLIKELKELARYREQVNTAVTHELKNPLTAIVGHQAYLTQALPDLDARQTRSLQAIGRAAARMGGLVESLLSLARVNDRKQPMIREVVDLSEVVLETCELLAGTAASSQLLIDHAAVQPECFVLGDESELTMVISNLVSNALKFTPEGGTITLTLSHDVAEGCIVFTCADDGPGVPEEAQATVFEEFTRLNHPEAHRKPGSGLGLAIVRRIVERHDGSVELRSPAPHAGASPGSEFTVRLPVNAVASAAQPANLLP